MRNMKRKISLGSGVALLGLGLVLSSCGERGEWMKEEALATEGLRRVEATDVGEYSESETTQERDGT